MNEVTVIGIDLAKGVYEVCLQARDGAVVSRRRLKRGAFERFMATAPRVLVGVEAGPGAHYWARWLSGQGFDVKVMSPKAVRAYRHGPHKSDALDAAAIAEAATRAQIRSVPVKSEQAQTQQALVRVRDRQVHERTRVLNQLRGLLLEFGIAASRNLLAWYPRIAETPEFTALPERARQLCEDLYAEAQELDRRSKALEKELARNVRVDPTGRLLTSVPGIGAINAAQVSAQIVEPGNFQRARGMSAYIGVVPRLIASGKTRRLGPITKHGSSELRRGLVLGAQSVINAALRHPDKSDPLYVFARRLIARGKPRNQVAVAVANKLARIVAVVLRSGQPYDPNHQAA